MLFVTLGVLIVGIVGYVGFVYFVQSENRAAWSGEPYPSG